MDSPTHTIDPDGEVIIILLNANSPFAQLDENPITSLDSDISSALCDNAQGPPEVTEIPEIPLNESKLTAKQRKMMKKKKRKITPAAEEPPAAEQAPAAEEPNAEETAVEEPVEEAADDAAAEEAAVEEAAVEEAAVEESASEESFTEVPVEICFRIQVSAKHLMFASPVFKKILTCGFKESITYSQKSSVEITAESWDIDALMIVLQAIHGQHYLISKELTLEMLAKVAVIADYYECKNALYLLTDTWIKNVEKDIPISMMPYRDLILWLWIAWVFQLHSQFKLSTSIAISQGNGWIDSLGLPIPDNVTGSINERREENINILINLLHGTLDDYLNGTRGCSFECCSIMYGALTKHMQASNLLLPRPETPFTGLSYESLVQKAIKLKSPQWQTSGHHWRHGSSYDLCNDSSFATVFATLKGPREGLELDRFNSS